MLTLILLAQLATATPKPTATGAPATAIKSAEPASGLAGAAGKTKIKKVDFSDTKAAAPAPSPPGRRLQKKLQSLTRTGRRPARI